MFPPITPFFFVAETPALELSIGKYRYKKDSTAVCSVTAVDSQYLIACPAEQESGATVPPCGRELHPLKSSAFSRLTVFHQSSVSGKLSADFHHDRSRFNHGRPSEHWIPECSF
jgi:hypothetical protein